MRRRHWIEGVNGGLDRSGLESGGMEVVGGGLRDIPAVNEHTLKRPVRLMVSIALLPQHSTPQRHIPCFQSTLGIRY